MIEDTNEREFLVRLSQLLTGHGAEIYSKREGWLEIYVDDAYVGTIKSSVTPYTITNIINDSKSRITYSSAGWGTK